MRTISRYVKANLRDPLIDGSGVLPRGNMWRVVQSTREQVRVIAQRSPRNPGLDCRPCLLRDFKLHGTLRLLLKHDCASGYAVAMSDISYAQFHQIARS